MIIIHGTWYNFYPLERKPLDATEFLQPDGSVARLKALLVAKEYAQTYGMGYSYFFP